MSDIISLQNLAGSVSAVEQSMEPTRLAVLYHSNCNSSNLSEYHLKFSQLMNKYSGFAKEYKSELNEFHKLLSNTIDIKQLKEKERLEKLERLEVISNSNLEIVDNEPIEDSPDPANSIANQQVNSSSDQHSEPDQEPEPEPIKTAPVKAEVVAVPNEPKPKPTEKKPVPAPKKAAKQSKSVKKNNTNKRQKTNRAKSQQKMSQNDAAKEQKKENKVEENKENEDNISNMDGSYKYDAEKLSYRCFRYNGVQKSSTLIYVGNLPWNLPQIQAKNKEDDQVQKQYNTAMGALQYFIRNKAKIDMKQIEETQLKHGWNGMYAIVRFRYDVPLDKIKKFIENVNEENTKFAEERKKEANKMEKTGKKNKKKASWKKRVFIRFNNNFRFYESEEEMYCDPSARNTLFIRNFDILDNKCHEELTYKLLDFGDLYEDIIIRVDRYGDPYCTATFKYIEDAIYCCNSEINFNGRMLELRYSKF